MYSCVVGKGETDVTCTINSSKKSYEREHGELQKKSNENKL